jgi:hypothetical protein
MTKKTLLVLLTLAAMLMLGGCFNLDIREDVDYPAGLFKETMAKINRIHAKDPARKGTVSKLSFLVYNGDDRQLITFSIPKVLLQTITHWAKDDDMKKNMEKNGRIKKYGNMAKDFDLEKLDLDRLGPGLLIEIEVAEDKVHALIWLE